MGVVANRKTVTVVAVLIAATVVFIIAHSLQGSEGSWEESNALAALFEPVFRRVYGCYCGVVAWMAGASPLEYGAFVRKVAHFAEYFLIGAECAVLAVELAGRVFSPHLWAVLFAVLAVAVFDEYVQAFAGRTSLVSDVVLDFCGGVAGIAVVLIAVRVFRRFRPAERQ